MTPSSIDTEVIDLLKRVGPGTMSSLAYDTAWVARLGEIDWELSSRALAWLADNQLEDGSWGAKEPFYYHDRVISTLAAMIALTYRGRRTQDKKKIERGLIALEKITDGADEGLLADPNAGTAGFEMIVPTLVAEAENLGLIKQQGERILGRLAQQRQVKLGLLHGKVINRNMTAAFSAEMAGRNGQYLLDIENLQEKNGSVGHSPSATAYFALYVKPGDPAALNYLHSIVSENGGAPNLAPFDVYEKSWVLWNLSLLPSWDVKILSHMRPHLDALMAAWKPGRGVGFSAGYSVTDGDDTIITYDVLNRFGYEVDIESVLSFEEESYFRCYDLEVGISPSVNIHALMALRNTGYESNHPKVQKVVKFLEAALGNKKYWTDKWHSSPYYTTSHFIIACAGYKNDFAQNMVDWVVTSQREDGSWGFFMPTAEETAYCLQALNIWQKSTGKKLGPIIRKGTNWLRQKLDHPPYQLWIGKGLYSADLVIKSAVNSALLLAEIN